MNTQDMNTTLVQHIGYLQSNNGYKQKYLKVLETLGIKEKGVNIRNVETPSSKAQIILSIVCDHMGVTIEDLKGAERLENLPETRYLFYGLTRYVKVSNESIGAMISRSQSSVSLGLKKHYKLLSENPHYNEQYEWLKSELINKDIIKSSEI